MSQAEGGFSHALTKISSVQGRGIWKVMESIGSMKVNKGNISLIWHQEAFREALTPTTPHKSGTPPEEVDAILI